MPGNAQVIGNATFLCLVAKKERPGTRLDLTPREDSVVFDSRAPVEEHTTVCAAPAEHEDRYADIEHPQRDPSPFAQISHNTGREITDRLRFFHQETASTTQRPAYAAGPQDLPQGSRQLQPVVSQPFEAPSPRRKASCRHRAGPAGSDRFLHRPSAAIRSRNIVRLPTGTGTGSNPLQ